MLPSSVDVPDIRTLIRRGFVANPGLNTVTVLDRVPLTNGTLVLFGFHVAAVDAAVPNDVSVTFQDGAMKVAAGALAVGGNVAGNKVTTGGAGTFSVDVDFAVIPNAGTGEVVLTAFNNNVAALTGNFVARYWLVRGAF